MQTISHNFRHIHEKLYSLTKTVTSSWRAWKQNPSSSKPPKTHLKIDSSVCDPHLNSITSELSEMDPVLQRNLGIITSAVALEKLAYSMEIGETIAVSDASLGPHSRASHAYIITAKSKKHLLRGFAPIDCDADDVDSTRAELYGQVAVHRILIALTNVFGVSSGEVAVHSDNSDSLCKNVVDLRKVSFLRASRPNVDLKLQIDSMRKSIKPLNIVPIHIKGHQVKDENFEF